MQFVVIVNHKKALNTFPPLKIPVHLISLSAKIIIETNQPVSILADLLGLVRK